MAERRQPLQFNQEDSARLNQGDSARQQERSRIKEQLADLRRRMPAHSVKPEFIRQLEDLEEKLAELEEDKDGA
ncbi:MAG: hypothetical protein M0021_01955 [Clostridia bacterium]|nr:hypothetical protein [Clostridia bacterium]